MSKRKKLPKKDNPISIFTEEQLKTLGLKLCSCGRIGLVRPYSDGKPLCWVCAPKVYFQKKRELIYGTIAVGLILFSIGFLFHPKNTDNKPIKWTVEVKKGTVQTN